MEFFRRFLEYLEDFGIFRMVASKDFENILALIRAKYFRGLERKNTLYLRSVRKTEYLFSVYSIYKIIKQRLTRYISRTNSNAICSHVVTILYVFLFFLSNYLSRSTRAVSQLRR